jgi:hypothetical protein
MRYGLESHFARSPIVKILLSDEKWLVKYFGLMSGRYSCLPTYLYSDLLKR